MKTSSIRPACLADAEALAGLSAELGYPTSVQEVTAILTTLLASDEHGVFVAEKSAGGEIVGWAHVFLTLRLASGSFAELGGLVVAGEYRRQGLGRELTRQTEQWARACGIDRLRLRSRETRGDAHRFYAQIGYHQVKKQVVFDKTLA